MAAIPTTAMITRITDPTTTVTGLTTATATATAIGARITAPIGAMADVLRAALIDDGIVGIKRRRQKTRYVAAMPKPPAEAWRGPVRRSRLTCVPGLILAQARSPLGRR